MEEEVFDIFSVIPKSLPSQWKPELHWLQKAQESSVYALCCDFFCYCNKKSPLRQKNTMYFSYNHVN